jgi:hypothetical protein
MDITMKKEIAEERISTALGFQVGNFVSFHDGFAFTVDSELNAYKAAYKYHGPNNRLVVKYAPNVEKWHVSLYEVA